MLTNLFQSFLLLESQCSRSLNKQTIFQSKIKDGEYIKYIKDSTKMKKFIPIWKLSCPWSC